ncbi:hypothetical protein ACFB49_42810 [Sphingomonas sp. DBB INV C78]|uniref:hypothetical protein n=1 Tax=Sphingomonas sp. DBB INV C78 TaxID=3349434 RepID=UPI0036D26A94
MTTFVGLDDENGKILLADTLRAFVGLGKRITWADLAEATGEKERTLRSYVETDPPMMSGPMLMRIFAALPPEAFGRVARRMGFATPRLLDVDDEATLRHALTEASKFVAEGTEALEDGDLNHIERARLAKRAESAIPKLALVANSGG